MMSNPSYIPHNIDVTAVVNTLHIGRDVTRVIFCNIAERNIKLILTAPLNGFQVLQLCPGYTLLCLCEPALLRETLARFTAFSQLYVHTYSEEIELKIVPNKQHSTCTTFVTVSFASNPPSLTNLAKAVIRANTTQKKHGSLSLEYFKFTPYNFLLAQNVGDTFKHLNVNLKNTVRYSPLLFTYTVCP